jgi:hypothetical protein
MILSIDSFTRINLKDSLNNTTIRRIRCVYLAAGFVSLLAGCGLEVLFRGRNLILFSELPSFLLVQSPLSGFNPTEPFVSFVCFNLPDGLWFLSGVLLIRSLWFGEKRWLRVYLSLFCGAALLLELIQLFPGVPGTFDPLDLITMAVFALTEGIIYKQVLRRGIV